MYIVAATRWQMRCDSLPGGEHYGLDFGDGMAPLLDLSFADFTLAEGGRSVGLAASLWQQMVGVFFDNKKMYNDRIWMWNIICKALLRHGIACSAAGHRTLYPRDARRYDIEIRKMLRRMIPPPVGIDWSAPWHVIVHLARTHRLCATLVCIFAIVSGGHN